MNLDNTARLPLTSSTLKVVASELLDVTQDLENSNEKSIAELINEEKEENNKETQG